MNNYNFCRDWGVNECLMFPLFFCDLQLKQYRFDLQIAINTTLNAIQSESGSNLNEKFVLLNRLLSGEVAEVSGRKVSTRGHTAGAIFVRDLFARQFAVSVGCIFPCMVLTRSTSVWLWSILRKDSKQEWYTSMTKPMRAHPVGAIVEIKAWSVPISVHFNVKLFSCH